MAAVGAGVADALDDSEMAFLVECLQALHRGMQAHLAGALEPERPGLRDRQGRAAAVIAVVFKRNDGVEAIIAAGELEHDQAVFPFGLLELFGRIEQDPGSEGKPGAGQLEEVSSFVSHFNAARFMVLSVRRRL